MMLGQRYLLERIAGQIDRGKFPRFSIIIGEKGSGKKLLSREIADMLGATCTYVSISVDNIREVIEESYKLIEPIVYVIPDCDNMSSAAANALLKVTEEPPQQAYFILTCENADNLLSTIKSRGVTYMLEPYSYDDLLDYLDTVDKRPTEKEIEFITDVASNIGEVQELLSLDLTAFENYVNLVIDNIAEVSGSNAFKIGEKVALKDETDKYGLKVFWSAFNSLCVNRMSDGNDPLRYALGIAKTGDYMQELHIRGINKQMLFDNWILTIREAWL